MLTPQGANEFFTVGNGHIATSAKRCVRARLLWVNPRADSIDREAFKAVGGWKQYHAHLLGKCAFLIDPDGHGEGEFVIDRYGGSGIGHNGGSGRTGFINGYNVKGIGRTPLVSALTPPSHASGGAYLEECVRETIFSEIAARCLPHSAVSTLAIIDIGEVQDWDTTWVPTKERRTLSVRSSFLRPAHFERATGFISSDAREGALDEFRVQQMFRQLLENSTVADAEVIYVSLISRWCDQLAWGFVNRLPHVSNTTSNISLDGRLVDFGAMTAVPSWCRTASSFYPEGFLEQIAAIARGMKSIGYFFAKHIPESSIGARREQLIATVRPTYERALIREVLNAVGAGWLYTEHYASNAMRLQRLTAIVLRLAHHFNRENLDMLESTAEPRLAFRLDLFWHESVDEPFRELRRELAALLTAEQISSLAAESLENAARKKLYFPEMKRDIYQRLDFSAKSDEPPSPEAVSALIDEYVSAGMPQRYVTNASAASAASCLA